MFSLKMILYSILGFFYIVIDLPTLPLLSSEERKKKTRETERYSIGERGQGRIYKT